MKVTSKYYNDDSILVAGHLVERVFRKPVFFPVDTRCGFDSQIIRNPQLLIPYSDQTCRDFYKRAYPTGTRIKMICMVNDPHPIPSGTFGTVHHVDDAPMLHCQFDNGRHLAVIPGVDIFSKVPEQNAEMEDIHG